MSRWQLMQAPYAICPRPKAAAPWLPQNTAQRNNDDKWVGGGGAGQHGNTRHAMHHGLMACRPLPPCGCSCSPTAGPGRARAPPGSPGGAPAPRPQRPAAGSGPGRRPQGAPLRCPPAAVQARREGRYTGIMHHARVGGIAIGLTSLHGHGSPQLKGRCCPPPLPARPAHLLVAGADAAVLHALAVRVLAVPRKHIEVREALTRGG